LQRRRWHESVVVASKHRPVAHHALPAKFIIIQPWIFMLQLILFRHAEADRPVAVADHERPLSETGCLQAQKMGEFIATQALRPDVTLISSARRTRQTWEQACDAGDLAVPHVVEPDIYEANPDDLIAILTRQSARHKSILVVGHN